MANVLHSAATGIHPGAYHQSSAPSSPATGILWVDTSTAAPLQLKMWDGAAWQDVGIISGGGGGGVSTAGIALTSDFTLTAATWTTAISMSCAAGTWVFFAQVQGSTGQNSQNIGARLFDGTNVLASMDTFAATSGTTLWASLVSLPVVLGSTLTISLQGNSQTAQTPGKFLHLSVAYGTTGATQLTGIKTA